MWERVAKRRRIDKKDLPTKKNRKINNKKKESINLFPGCFVLWCAQTQSVLLAAALKLK
jgi:lantibiotic modifying enzyme